MEISEMKHSDIEMRLAEIQAELKNDDADVDRLSAEVDELEKRENALKAEAEEKRALIEKVTTANIPVIEERKEETKMTNVEIRNTPEYIDAYAEYIKSGKDAECRALLTENGSGAVPVPEFVYEIVKTAWERQGIMALVRKTYLKGNLKVGFEISGDGAVKHTEGGDAISPENLILGTINIVPASIKKVLQISDEVYDLRGQDFLNYVYDELTYRIAKKCADELLALIEACSTVSTTTQVGVPVLTANSLGVGTIAQAMALLSDDAGTPAVVMNKATWGAFKNAQAGANYAYDPFEGLPVLFNNTITAYNVATTGDTYAIVGDFGQGAIANFPNGENIEFKFDEMTLKKQDLIEIMGRQYVGLGVVAPNAFVKIQK